MTLQKAVRVLATFAISLIVLVACTPYYVNTMDFGKAATFEEIKTHFSGKSFRGLSYLGHNKGKRLPDWDSEMYFSPDGTWYNVNFDEPLVFRGQWYARKKTEEIPVDTLVRSGEVEVWNGKVRRLGSVEGVALFRVHIQPDGSVILDELGGLNASLSQPRNGFPYKNRFNSLMPLAKLKAP